MECHNDCRHRQNTLLRANSVVGHDRMFVVIFKLLHPDVRACLFFTESSSFKKSSLIQKVLTEYSHSNRAPSVCVGVRLIAPQFWGGVWLSQLAKLNRDHLCLVPHARSYLRRKFISRSLCGMCWSPQTEVRSQWRVFALLFKTFYLIQKRWSPECILESLHLIEFSEHVWKDLGRYFQISTQWWFGALLAEQAPLQMVALQCGYFVSSKLDPEMEQ